MYLFILIQIETVFLRLVKQKIGKKSAEIKLENEDVDLSTVTATSVA